MNRVLTLALAVAVLATSCEGRKANQKIREAAALHTAFMEKYDALYHKLLDEKARITSAVDQPAVSEEERGYYEAILRSIDRSFVLLADWEQHVIGVPGLELDHHHHHDHDHGHDHHHHHDHYNDDLLSKMSDDEILAMQRALSARLDEVSTEIETMLSAVQLYEERKP
jgi:ABC-type nickel/cobalt efflux system permease component RcnA